MKIIISPAKSLDFENEVAKVDFTQPEFLDFSSQLIEELKKYKVQELSELMKISKNLAELNYQRNLDWSLPFNLSNSKQAVFAFTGDVYKGLDVNTILPTKIGDLQDKLRILSGLYGILKPLDLIQPYRLEMGTKLPNSVGKNLYEFWGDTLVDALNKEMKTDEVLVDLASQEYSKSIPKKKLKAKLITPVFKELKGDQYKVVGIYAKKARGLMVRYIVDCAIESEEGLKGFNTDGYAFSEEFSTSSEFVFTR